VARRDAPQHGRIVASAGDLRGEPTDRALPDMPMRVDQAGDHEPALRVDYLSVRRRRSKIAADVGNDAVTDEHVSFDEVTKARVDSDNVAALNKNLFGHGQGMLRSSGVCVQDLLRRL
jgi:hypothetical protein